ncbi:MAG TPA: hypothetical protein DCQ92_01370 [Verrucomicrobia subdivision 3 bacterium]|nr:hypothetical protein [Limisphaerales bacterium]
MAVKMKQTRTNANDKLQNAQSLRTAAPARRVCAVGFYDSLANMRFWVGTLFAWILVAPGR